MPPMLDRKHEQKNLDHKGSLKANELVAPIFYCKTRTTKVYGSKTHLDRVRHSCLRRRKGFINSNDPFNAWGGGRGCNKSIPVLGGNGTKIAPTEDIFDHPPGQMR